MEGEVAPGAALPKMELRRRGVRLALRIGVMLLGSGAQSQEAEEHVRRVMRAFGLRGGDAIVTSDSVSVSYIAPGDAETTTAIQAVRDWRPDFSQLAQVAALVRAIIDGRIDIPAAERELDRIGALVSPYPHWLRFAAPALLAGAVTIMFGGSPVDAAATLAIGLALQPAQERIERSALPLFFQTVFGVSATVLLVVALAGLRFPIDASLVLTGGLLRFLPGGQLVSGMRDLIARKIVPGTANLAEVMLLGVAIAASASLVMVVGRTLLGVDLSIAGAGRHDWPVLATLVAGIAAVSGYAIRLGVPRDVLASVALLGGLIVLVAEGVFDLAARTDPNVRTLVAALLVGLVGRTLANRWDRPAAIWLAPTILPLLPAPATLLPLLAETEQAREALQGQALATAFLIGVGVASGDIVASAYGKRPWRRKGRRGGIKPS